MQLLCNKSVGHPCNGEAQGTDGAGAECCGCLRPALKTKSKIRTGSSCLLQWGFATFICMYSVLSMSYGRSLLKVHEAKAIKLPSDLTSAAL